MVRFELINPTCTSWIKSDLNLNQQVQRTHEGVDE